MEGQAQGRVWEVTDFLLLYRVCGAECLYDYLRQAPHETSGVCPRLAVKTGGLKQLFSSGQRKDGIARTELPHAWLYKDLGKCVVTAEIPFDRIKQVT